MLPLRILLLASGVALTLAAAGCPAHQVGIIVSADAIHWLTGACTPTTSDPCFISDHPLPDLAGRAFEARLFLVLPSDGTIRDASKCMSIAACPDSRSHQVCLAEALNQQLDGAIPSGLGFDGLHDPGQVQLLLAIYQAADPAVADVTCGEANLVACAGFAEPLGGGNFDISCASCQGGSKTPAGRDNTPCSAPRGCFLRTCDAIARGRGLQ